MAAPRSQSRMSSNTSRVQERVEPPLGSDEPDIQAELKRVTSELSEQGLNASLVIRSEVGSRPANEIADIAREFGADLIVAGTHGHTAPGGFWVGSVTRPSAPDLTMSGAGSAHTSGGVVAARADTARGAGLSSEESVQDRPRAEHRTPPSRSPRGRTSVEGRSDAAAFPQ